MAVSTTLPKSLKGSLTELLGSTDFHKIIPMVSLDAAKGPDFTSSYIRFPRIGDMRLSMAEIGTIFPSAIKSMVHDSFEIDEEVLRDELKRATPSVIEMLRERQRQIAYLDDDPGTRRLPSKTNYTVTAKFEMTAEKHKVVRRLFQEQQKILQNLFYVSPLTREFPTLWATRYESKGSERLTTLYAASREEAERLCTERGLRERLDDKAMMVSPPTLASVHVTKGNYTAAAHAATWLGMIATAAKIIEPLELLIDDGILHEIAHIVQSGENLHPHYHSYSLVQRIIELERLTPGMWPVFSNREDHFQTRLETQAFFQNAFESHAPQRLENEARPSL